MASPASDRPAERRAREGRVVFRVSDEDIATLDAKAAAAGMGRSELLRALIYNVRIRHRRDEARRLALLTRINTNLNGLLKWANIHKGAAETQIVASHLRAVEREITRLIDAQEHL
jgi:hypothetical protein